MDIQQWVSFAMFALGCAVGMVVNYYLQLWMLKRRSNKQPKPEFVRRTYQQQAALKKEFDRKKRRARITTAHMSQPRPWWNDR